MLYAADLKQPAEPPQQLAHGTYLTWIEDRGRCNNPIELGGFSDDPLRLFNSALRDEPSWGLRDEPGSTVQSSEASCSLSLQRLAQLHMETRFQTERRVCGMSGAHESEIEMAQ